MVKHGSKYRKYGFGCIGQGKTKQENYKIRPDNYKTRQDKTRHDMTREDETRRDNARQDKTRQRRKDKTR